jgi:hypothetical protein
VCPVLPYGNRLHLMAIQQQENLFVFFFLYTFLTPYSFVVTQTAKTKEEDEEEKNIYINLNPLKNLSHQKRERERTIVFFSGRKRQKATSSSR